MNGSFATLNFERRVSCSVATLWQAWTDPAARAIWAAHGPTVTVEFLEANTRVGGREVSLCRVAGEPDIRCDLGWLVLSRPHRSVNSEVLSSDGATPSAALVTADIVAHDSDSELQVTVQLSSTAEDMARGYRQGFASGLDNLAGVARRMMVIERVIAAPPAVVWGAWVNPQTLPLWWGPDGFTCRTTRIDLRTGGEWVFDMIGPDGTVFPNHHRYVDLHPPNRLGYTLHAGEGGPKHADAWARFDEVDGATHVTLVMVFATQDEFAAARDFGATKLGQQTLGKLARFIGAVQVEPVDRPDAD